MNIEGRGERMPCTAKAVSLDQALAPPGSAVGIIMSAGPEHRGEGGRDAFLHCEGRTSVSRHGVTNSG